MKNRTVEIVQSAMREFLSEDDPAVLEAKDTLIPSRSGGWAVMNPHIVAFLPDMTRKITIQLEGVWNERTD